MVIPGIPDEHIERIHWWFGPGKVSECAYRHIPSGIVVGGPRPPDISAFDFDRQLLAAFVEKLKAAGIVKDEETRGEPVGG